MRISNNCNSLRSVTFNHISDIKAQLDVIQANHNVKQWVLNLAHVDITKSYGERLQQILSEKNDNSLVVYKAQKKVSKIPQSTQLFKILPVSYF